MKNITKLNALETVIYIVAPLTVIVGFFVVPNMNNREIAVALFFLPAILDIVSGHYISKNNSRGAYLLFIAAVLGFLTVPLIAFINAVLGVWALSVIKKKH
jgi:hypothetical protein